MSQFIKDTYISEKKYQKVHNLQDKTGYQNYKVSVTAIAKLMPATFLILIFTNQNLSKANDKTFKKFGSPHFLSRSFFHTLRIIVYHNTRFSVCFFIVYMSICMEKIKIIDAYSFLIYF